jgi:hypothetical protein
MAFFVTAFQKVICQTEIPCLHSFIRLTIKSSGAKLWEENELCGSSDEELSNFWTRALVKRLECASETENGGSIRLNSEMGRKRKASSGKFTYVCRLEEDKHTVVSVMPLDRER